MAVSLEEFNKIKQKTEKLQQDLNRAEGVRASCLDRLRELGFETLDEAERGLEELENDLREAEKEYNEQLQEFKEKWGDLLEL